MRGFTLTVRPDRSALAFGGWSSPRLGGDKATARDADLRPVLPASALRGALRIELERLLAGTGQPACSANALTPGPSPSLPPKHPGRGETQEEAPSSPGRVLRGGSGEEGRGGEGPCPCAICRLFGTDGGATGTLRLEDAVLQSDEGQVELLRPTIAVSRRTGTVVEGHLGFAETTDILTDAVFTVRGWLVPRSPDDTPEVLEKDFHHLAAACRALTAIGGGKARGVGWVTCELRAFPAPQPSPPRPREEGVSSSFFPSPGGSGGDGRGDRGVRFRAQAPLHFGDGRPIAYFQPTLSFAPGSAVRGALAFALLERGILKPGDEVFEQLFGRKSEVSFGSATPEGWAPCATRRRCRPNDHVFDDLVAEIVRRMAARHGVALKVKTACRDCTDATKLLPEPWLQASERPGHRVRTRTALNRKTGTSMDRKLFSIESLEPPLTLTARVTGLSPKTEEALARLDGEQVWLGGKRSQGSGLCEVTIDKAAPAGAIEIRQLTERVNAAWTELQSVVPGVEALLSPSDTLLALVLDEPWRPEGAAADEALYQGPLPPSEAGEPLVRFVEVSEEGRFGAIEAGRWGATEPGGESQPVLAAAPGSVYVYKVAGGLTEERLEQWLETGRRGTGENRALGWGRFRVWNEEER